MKTYASLAASAALLYSATVQAESLYTKNSPVLQVTAKTYANLIAKSNHTSIIEFYAPWCGHCQRLQPAYEKAARSLKGLAKVAAVNCDVDDNKPFCGEMGIKGFPTLKIIRPSRKTGRPTTEEYQGERTAKAIVDAVVEKIPNHVTRLTDKSMNRWLRTNKENAKAILFTEKGTTSALLRALAIDYLGSIDFGQVRNKEATAVEKFGITEYPTFVLVPSGDNKENIVYSGEMKKVAMSDFLSQVALPNPDPVPQKSKAKTAKDKTAKKDRKIKVPKPVEEDEKRKEADRAQTDKEATEAPPKGEAAEPVVPVINDETTLREQCFQDTSKLCALVLLPDFDPKKGNVPEGMIEGLRSIAEVYSKHNKRHALFPFYLVEPSLPLVSNLREQLGLKPTDEMDMVVVNGKKGWYRKYTASDFSINNVEAWVDAVRMNEGKKEDLPHALITTREARQEMQEGAAQAMSKEKSKEAPKEAPKEESSPEAETKKSTKEKDEL